MVKADLKDPRELYKVSGFEEQEQPAPALQGKMRPKPDCGEADYQGREQLMNRKVLITGGDSGIGRAVAIAFSREGADIALQYLPGEESDANEVAGLIESAGRKAVLIPADFKMQEAPQQVVAQAVAQLGGLDTVVLNAAQQIARPTLEDLPIQQVRDSFEINVVAMYGIAKAAIAHIPAGGSILTTTSIQGFNPSSQLLGYAATKAAIRNFTINLAQQLADKGIRVNGVAPGPIWTPLQLAQGQLEGALPKFGQNTLLKRAGQPVEVAPVYVFLASNAASYITGQIYGVTGGESIN